MTKSIHISAVVFHWLSRVPKITSDCITMLKIEEGKRQLLVFRLVLGLDGFSGL